MKTFSFFCCIAVIFLISITNFGCKKNESTPSGVVPTVVTGGHSNVTSTTADCSGTITSIGSSGITSSGINYWVGGASCSTGGGTLFLGTFTVKVGDMVSTSCDLKPNTDYSYRAYAINSAGTGYGETLYFKTLP
jgi:hypothetical protein